MRGTGCKRCEDNLFSFNISRSAKAHWLVRAVVHIQNFINRRCIKYPPFGPWPHWIPAAYLKQRADEGLEDSDEEGTEDSGGSDESNNDTE